MSKKRSFRDYYKEQPVEINIGTSINESNLLPPDPIASESKDIAEHATQILTEGAIREILREQQEITKKVLDSIIETNAAIVESMNNYTKSTADASVPLLEAINTLSQKIQLLESKIENIKNFEIPAPIVNVSYPKKTCKNIHRDAKGFITHVTEEIIGDEDQTKTTK